MVPSPICLKFTEEVPSAVRSRISYAFRVFAAIYNYRVAEADTEQGAICFEYGVKPSLQYDSRCLWVPARYRGRSAHTPVEKLVKRRYANEDLFLFHGVDGTTGNPDWLGEIFEWLSSSDELCIAPRDSVGRIPYREMIFSRLGISPCKPHATLLMAWMENFLRNGNGKEALPKATSPIAGAEHIVVCSQDIDFHYVDKISALVRLIKNLGISVLTVQSWPFFFSSLNLLAGLLMGKRVGDYLPVMLEKMAKCGFQSTLFAVPRRGHRRDPNYRLEDMAPYLYEASKRGFPVELHGSYTSVVDGMTLSRESLALEEVMRTKPLGNRQHWLRFDHHENLFRAIESAELIFDSTLGFSEMVGFRNGASFAFPPYDFKNEAPHRFLEIPLALMDVSLEAASRTLRKHPQELADEVLQQSRKWSWGGISVLWHNPMEPLHVPKEINRVFWNCASKRGQSSERWVSARQFMAQCLRRYQDAGLMEGVCAGVPPAQQTAYNSPPTPAR